jgi:site-specific DNA-methyltransferase (adenine-specific)
VGYGDRGGASRFFYTGKASRAERNAGLDDFEAREVLWSNGTENPGSFQSDGTERAQKNFHPTVKPLDLMRWLVRLLTPPGGLVVDLFAGSGTTGCACALEGMNFVGVEREDDYIRIAEARIRFWASKPAGIETKRVLRAEAEKPERSGQLSIL